MFVQIEETPNPHTVKFLPGIQLLGDGEPTLSFSSFEEAVHAPFASRLLDIEGVKHILFGPTFISVTKHEAHQWAHLKPFLFHAIVECITRKIPLLGDMAPATLPSSIVPDLESYDEGTRAIVLSIIGVIDSHIRPAVARDGGDVQFIRYEQGVVYLLMRGACAGCPSAAQTLKNGIESTLKTHVPEVLHVCEASSIHLS